MIVEVLHDVKSGARQLCWLCPGCRNVKGLSPYHMVPVKLAGEPAKVQPTWDWNGSTDSPTLTPSVRHNYNSDGRTCHYFIRDGQIAFCGDSFHDLKNKTVPMLEIKEPEAPNPAAEEPPKP